MTWRERFHEDNAFLYELLSGRVGYLLGKTFLIVAFLTFMKQIALRWPACTGAIECGISFTKGAVWAVVWPFYWLNYATDFVLVRPFG